MPYVPVVCEGPSPLHWLHHRMNQHSTLRSGRSSSVLSSWHPWGKGKAHTLRASGLTTDISSSDVGGSGPSGETSEILEEEGFSNGGMLGPARIELQVGRKEGKKEGKPHR
jgi:hypothetical protein